MPNRIRALTNRPVKHVRVVNFENAPWFGSGAVSLLGSPTNQIANRCFTR
jgi:hypothetical protein